MALACYFVLEALLDACMREGFDALAGQSRGERGNGMLSEPPLRGPH
jgi:hypothetical protein